MREPVYIFSNEEYHAIVSLVKDALVDVNTSNNSGAEMRLERALRYLYFNEEILEK